MHDCVSRPSFKLNDNRSDITDLVSKRSRCLQPMHTHRDSEREIQKSHFIEICRVHFKYRAPACHCVFLRRCFCHCCTVNKYIKQLENLQRVYPNSNATGCCITKLNYIRFIYAFWHILNVDLSFNRQIFRNSKLKFCVTVRSFCHWFGYLFCLFSFSLLVFGMLFFRSIPLISG